MHLYVRNNADFCASASADPGLEVKISAVVSNTKAAHAAQLEAEWYEEIEQKTINLIPFRSSPSVEEVFGDSVSQASIVPVNTGSSVAEKSSTSTIPFSPPAARVTRIHCLPTYPCAPQPCLSTGGRHFYLPTQPHPPVCPPQKIVYCTHRTPNGKRP